MYTTSTPPATPFRVGQGLGSATQQNTKGTEMCSGSEAGSYLRLIDSCVTQLKAQAPSRICNESGEEEEKTERDFLNVPAVDNP